MATPAALTSLRKPDQINTRNKACRQVCVCVFFRYFNFFSKSLSVNSPHIFLKISEFFFCASDKHILLGSRLLFQPDIEFISV